MKTTAPDARIFSVHSAILLSLAQRWVSNHQSVHTKGLHQPMHSKHSIVKYLTRFL